jgi:hypothetical protein
VATAGKLHALHACYKRIDGKGGGEGGKGHGGGLVCTKKGSDANAVSACVLCTWKLL